MNTTQPMPDLVLEIAGTFDVARARNRLRRLVELQKLPLMLRARSAATLTTLSELVLFKSNVRDCSFDLAISILKDAPDTYGIQFAFIVPLTTEISKRFVVAEWQLERSCDEIGISNRGEYDYIVMRLWARRRRNR